MAKEIRDIVDKIIIAPGKLRIDISSVGLMNLVGVDDRETGHPVSLDLPISIRRRGVESKIILLGSSRPPNLDVELIKVISGAHRWFAQIAGGSESTVRVIARTEKIDEGDVSRFLPFVFLAPDIIEAILSGKQPVELTAEKLKRYPKLPKSWDEQRKVLGFPE